MEVVEIKDISKSGLCQISVIPIKLNLPTIIWDLILLKFFAKDLTFMWPILVVKLNRYTYYNLTSNNNDLIKSKWIIYYTIYLDNWKLKKIYILK